MFLFLSCVIAFLLRVTLCTDCPDGFESHHGNCYFFSHGQESWTGAYESCKFFKAKLVEIETADEENYIASKVGTLGDFNYWIGLTDKLVENEFVWETSLQLLSDTGYTNWAQGEPDGQGKENCVFYTDDNKWADGQCTRTERYICEKGDSSGTGEIVG